MAIRRGMICLRCGRDWQYGWETLKEFLGFIEKYNK